MNAATYAICRYGWVANNDRPVKETLAKQKDYVVSEFETRAQRVLLQLQVLTDELHNQPLLI